MAQMRGIPVAQMIQKGCWQQEILLALVREAEASSLNQSLVLGVGLTNLLEGCPNPVQRVAGMGEIAPNDRPPEQRTAQCPVKVAADLEMLWQASRVQMVLARLTWMLWQASQVQTVLVVGQQAD
jgi:hypothetical protein